MLRKILRFVIFARIVILVEKNIGVREQYLYIKMWL
jgi:hypothetical protein